MSVDDFGIASRRLLRASRAIALSSRISVSDAPSSPAARRDEKLFVSEVKFNDGVQRAVAADQFENLEIHNLYEGEISIELLRNGRVD